MKLIKDVKNQKSGRGQGRTFWDNGNILIYNLI